MRGRVEWEHAKFLPMLNRRAVCTVGTSIGLAIAPPIQFLSTQTDSIAATMPRVDIRSIAMSPSGHLIAVHYIAASMERVGVYDLSTDSFFAIPNTPGRLLKTPSFTSDGAHLIVVEGDKAKGKDLLLLDLKTQSVRRIPIIGDQPGTDIFFPASSADGRQIIYVEKKTFRQCHLKSVSLQSLKISTVLREENGFEIAIFRPIESKRGSLYFSAISPSSVQLLKEVEDLGGDIASEIVYELRPGENPTILYPELERQRRKLYRNINLVGFNFSTTTATAYFLDSTNRQQSPSPITGLVAPLNIEIHSLSSTGRIEQLTDMKGHIARLAVSANGQRAAFTFDETRSRNWRLMVLDLASRRVRELKTIPAL
jgi:hypothetical protein